MVFLVKLVASVIGFFIAITGTAILIFIGLASSALMVILSPLLAIGVILRYIKPDDLSGLVSGPLEWARQRIGTLWTTIFNSIYT